MALISDSYVRVLSELEGSVGGMTAMQFDENPDDTPEREAVQELGFRRAVLSSLMSLPRPFVGLVCCEPGMGRAELLMRLVSSLRLSGNDVRFEDFSSCGHDDAGTRLSELVRAILRRCSVAEGVTLVCDNFSCSDEADAERCVRHVRRALQAGCSVVLGISTASEILCDRLDEARCFWACDLCLPKPLSGDEALLYERYTYGIPALACAASKVDPELLPHVQSAAGYQEAYAGVVDEALWHSSMEEERRTRLGALLLGFGSIAELREVVGRIDDVSLRSCARDVPLLGMSMARERFCCVDGHSTDGIHAAFATLAHASRGCPELVSRVVKVLVSRNDFRRAALVSTLCSDEHLRCAIGLEWGSEFVNAGEVSVVIDAVAEAREGGRVAQRGLFETSCVLAALGCGQDVAEFDQPHLWSSSTRRGRYAQLAYACRALLRGHVPGTVLDDSEDDDDLARALVAHGRVIDLLRLGRIADAYAQALLPHQTMEEGGVVRVLERMDALACATLMGIFPAKAEMDEYARDRQFLEDAGLVALLSLHDGLPSLVRALVGHEVLGRELEAGAQRADRMHDTLLYGLFMLGLGIADLREGIFGRAHVRLELARRAFDKSHARFWEASARLIDCTVRFHLGEVTACHGLAHCEGVSPSLDAVVRVLGAAMRPDAVDASATMSEHGDMRCPGEVLWLVNVLSRFCENTASKVRAGLPQAWRGQLSRFSAPPRREAPIEPTPVPKGSVPMLAELRLSHRAVGPDARGDSLAPVVVKMLGGLEVRVGNSVIRESRLCRRRAKSLLALLVAIPGHVAKRYAIMESVWPTYDYESANKCVYSATSVLRSELGGDRDNKARLALVSSNKGAGTVALDRTQVTCDVDLFEEGAKRLLSTHDNDPMTVDACLAMEDLYVGDLFVPPNDGMGIVAARAKELRSLFVDVLVAGAGAAMRMSRTTLACRLALKAHNMDADREDVILVAVRMLCAAGRSVEAEGLYDGFVERMVDLTRKPPSRQLRADVGALLGQPSANGRGRREAPSRSGVVVSTQVPPLVPGQLAFDF